VLEVLNAVLNGSPEARGYLFDDQRHLRKHIAVFVNGAPVKDREGLSDAVGDTDEIYVMQALSGG
jgi:sulfur carrier protein ThiS